MKTLLISGGSGRLCKEIIKSNTKYKIHAPDKCEMDITDINSIRKTISEVKPDIFLHPAAITRPMIIHDETPHISVETNIIGTSNVVLGCMESGIKLVYISTDYVYPGRSGGYHESHPLLPINKYAWSKLGGECAVRMYDNSLVLRCCICEKPFSHPKAFVDVKKSIMYNTDASKIILDLLEEFGTINVGGETQTVYDFVKKTNPDIETISIRDIESNVAEDTSMCIDKMKEILCKK